LEDIIALHSQIVSGIRPRLITDENGISNSTGADPSLDGERIGQNVLRCVRNIDGIVSAIRPVFRVDFKGLANHPIGISYIHNGTVVPVAAAVQGIAVAFPPAHQPRGRRIAGRHRQTHNIAISGPIDISGLDSIVAYIGGFNTWQC